MATDTEIYEAIDIIEAARGTHVLWRDYYVAGSPPTKHVGDRAHHEKYIADYDKVLTVLRKARQGWMWRLATQLLCGAPTDD